MIHLIAAIAISYCFIKIMASPINRRSYQRAYFLCGIINAQGFVNREILFSKFIIEQMLFLPVILILFFVSSSNHFIINPYILVLFSLLLMITKHTLTNSKTSTIE